jgi:hypothetical protein
MVSWSASSSDSNKSTTSGFWGLFLELRLVAGVADVEGLPIEGSHAASSSFFDFLLRDEDEARNELCSARGSVLKVLPGLIRFALVFTVSGKQYKWLSGPHD